MAIRLAMHERSLAHIRARLDALGLDLEILPFDDDGRFEIGGAKVPAAEVDVDYLWLSSHVGQGKDGGNRRHAFDTTLACRSVGVLQTFNAGLDDPFYAELSRRGTRICNSSAQGVAIAEYTLAQVMAVLHPIELQRRQQAAKEWKITRFREISRTRWLIVGFGPIGSAVAERVRAFGAKVDVVRRSPAPSPLADRVGTIEDLPEFLPDADIILLAAPLSDQTRGLAGAEFFAQAKEGAILVNISRGGVVDDAALIAALDAGRLETAILDVFHKEPLPQDDPLWTHPKVRLTPHTSFAGDGGQGRWDQLFLDNIQRYARGEPLEREVDPKDI